MADHNKPTLTSTYSNFVNELDGRFDDIALGLDPAITSPLNLPVNSIRWTSAESKWQKWNGSTWNDLSSNYQINITGTVNGDQVVSKTEFNSYANTIFTAIYNLLIVGCKFVDVKDCNYVGGSLQASAVAINSTDSGNNNGWIIS